MGHATDKSQEKIIKKESLVRLFLLTDHPKI